MGVKVVVLTRDASGQAPDSHVRYVEWEPDGKTAGWALDIDGADAVVNLAGTGIADGRWSDTRKVEIRSSRVLATRNRCRRAPRFTQADCLHSRIGRGILRRDTRRSAPRRVVPARRRLPG